MVTLPALKFLPFPISKEVSHEMGSSGIFFKLVYLGLEISQASSFILVLETARGSGRSQLKKRMRRKRRLSTSAVGISPRVRDQGSTPSKKKLYSNLPSYG